MRVCDYVIEYIYNIGVRDVFLLTGGGVMYLNNAIALHGKIRPICMQHEQTMAMAVKAYAMAGGFGVGVFTSGPGSINALTGVCEAWLDSVPCLFISGQANDSETSARQTGVQAINIVEIVKSVTKYSCLVTNPLSIKAHLDSAVLFAKQGRPGPSWLDIPLNVQSVNYSR